MEAKEIKEVDNSSLNLSINELRNCHEKKIQESYKGKTFQIVDNRAVKSKIIIDRPRGFPVEHSLISNAETKKPIRYKVEDWNIILMD